MYKCSQEGVKVEWAAKLFYSLWIAKLASGGWKYAFLL
jgi:hypothetical protein